MYEISGITLLAMVVGIVEFLKRLGLDGVGNIIASVVTGAVIGGLYMTIEQGLMPEAAIPWVNVGIFGVGFGLAAAGLYDLGKRSGNGLKAAINNRNNSDPH